jgi:FHA domain
MGGAPMGGPPMGGPAMPPPMGPPPGVPGFSPSYVPPAPSAAASPAGGMRRCPSCGSDVPPTFRFCGTCGFRMDEQSGAMPMPQPGAPAPMGGAPISSAPARARLSMTLIRPDGSEGGTHELRQGENKLGRSFGPVFENDGYLSPIHAQLDIRGQQGMVRDLDSLNGVFVKMTGEEELTSGQIIRIGQELLRFELIGAPEPTADGTELMGSPNPGYWGKLTVIIGRDITGAAFPLLGEQCTLGRERGEINFPDDGYVSGLHARVSLRDGRVFLTDLGSSNGTFVKVNSERAVGHESFVLLGQQLFRLNFT